MGKRTYKREVQLYSESRRKLAQDAASKDLLKVAAARADHGKSVRFTAVKKKALKTLSGKGASAKTLNMGSGIRRSLGQLDNDKPAKKRVKAGRKAKRLAHRARTLKNAANKDIFDMDNMEKEDQEDVAMESEHPGTASDVTKAAIAPKHPNEVVLKKNVAFFSSKGAPPALSHQKRPGKKDFEWQQNVAFFKNVWNS